MKLSQYKLISPEIYASVEAALAKHGLKLVKSSAGVDEMIGEISLKFTAQDTNMGEAPEAIRWKQYAHAYGLNPDWLGATLKFGNGPCTLLGLLNTRSAKCVAVEQANGKRAVCSVEALKRVAKASGLSDPTITHARSLADFAAANKLDI